MLGVKGLEINDTQPLLPKSPQSRLRVSYDPFPLNSLQWLSWPWTWCTAEPSASSLPIHPSLCAGPLDGWWCSLGGRAMAVESDAAQLRSPTAFH